MLPPGRPAARRNDSTRRSRSPTSRAWRVRARAGARGPTSPSPSLPPTPPIAPFPPSPPPTPPVTLLLLSPRHCLAPITERVAWRPPAPRRQPPDSIRVTAESPKGKGAKPPTTGTLGRPLGSPPLAARPRPPALTRLSAPARPLPAPALAPSPPAAAHSRPRGDPGPLTLALAARLPVHSPTYPKPEPASPSPFSSCSARDKVVGVRTDGRVPDRDPGRPSFSKMFKRCGGDSEDRGHEFVPFRSRCVQGLMLRLHVRATPVSKKRLL